MVTPNTECSWDFTTKTRSTNDDGTSLDLEWEDEEGESWISAQIGKLPHAISIKHSFDVFTELPFKLDHTESELSIYFSTKTECFSVSLQRRQGDRADQLCSACSVSCMFTLLSHIQIRQVSSKDSLLLLSRTQPFSSGPLFSRHSKEAGCTVEIELQRWSCRIFSSCHSYFIILKKSPLSTVCFTLTWGLCLYQNPDGVHSSWMTGFSDPNISSILNVWW